MMKRRQRRVTEFEKRVYAAVARIPRGRVSTYGLVAGAIGCGSSRAVGQALKRNPFAPRVPCHRVIASDMRIGGFQGRRAGPAVRRKVRMLAKEGVAFRDGRVRDSRRVWTFGSSAIS